MFVLCQVHWGSFQPLARNSSLYRRQRLMKQFVLCATPRQRTFVRTWAPISCAQCVVFTRSSFRQSVTHSLAVSVVARAMQTAPSNSRQRRGQSNLKQSVHIKTASSMAMRTRALRIVLVEMSPSFAHSALTSVGKLTGGRPFGDITWRNTSIVITASTPTLVNCMGCQSPKIWQMLCCSRHWRRRSSVSFPALNSSLSRMRTCIQATLLHTSANAPPQKPSQTQPPLLQRRSFEVVHQCQSKLSLIRLSMFCNAFATSMPLTFAILLMHTT